MATYAIGDVQGCYDELCRLLEKLRFDESGDRLWFAGDLVNRGPHSLKVLRLVRALGKRAVTVLGNHDLHLVSSALSGRVRTRDTFSDVLRAEDCEALIGWLRRRPLVHVDDGFVLVHAGLSPQWTVAEARRHCTDASDFIASRRADGFLVDRMYGDEPRRWSGKLADPDRTRYVINACTRMRVCAPDGSIDPDYKGRPDTRHGHLPWFQVPGRKAAGQAILFGHWSMLGKVRWAEENVYGLDTGCVWGGRLTALRLEDRRLFSVAGRRYSTPG